MKVEIGKEAGAIGTVEATADGFLFEGDVDRLQRIITDLHRFYPHYTPEQLLADMPRMYNNEKHWTRVIPEEAKP